jgi:hypothetical protein
MNTEAVAGGKDPDQDKRTSGTWAQNTAESHETGVVTPVPVGVQADTSPSF